MTFHYFDVLKKRNFFLLWFGQVVSQFGDRLTQMALIGLVYKSQPGSSVGLAKMMSLAIIPVFLLSPIAGVYVDRWNKRKTMYISDLLRAIFIFFIPIMFLKSNSLIPVYILIFLSFCSGRFFIPAKMAIVPSLVNKEQIFLANSLISITAMIAAMLGFGIGGVIVEKLGITVAFFIDALTFLLSFLSIFLMRVEEKANFNPKDIIELGKKAIISAKNSFIFEIKEGYRYILNSKETLYAAKTLFVLFASIGSLYTVFIIFIQNTLSTVTSDLGWLAVAAGGGLFIGSVIYGRFGSKISVKIAVNLSLIFASGYLAIFSFILRANPSKIFAFYSCLVIGLVVSPVIIAVNTLIHNESDNTFWGRIFSSLEVVIHLAFIVFMFTASYLAEVMTPLTIIISVAILIFIFSLTNFIFIIRNGKQ